MEKHMVRTIVAEKKIDCTNLLGQFLDESHYDTLVEEDTNFFAPPGCSVLEDCEKDCSSCPTGIDEKRVGFIFRKNFFTEEQQRGAYDGLREAATQSQNRGLASGPRVDTQSGREWVTREQVEILQELASSRPTLIDGYDPIDEIRRRYKNDKSEDSRGQVWLVNKIKAHNVENFDNWVESVRHLEPGKRAELAKAVIKECISATTYANAVFSGIAGWFDRYPRIPYGRATSYTEHRFETFAKAFPFLQQLNDAFREILPWRWNNQNEAARKIDPAFLVPETVFTTITVNKSFRTAAHLDAGDFSDGLSNLSVLSNDGRYTGGYLVLPEYRVAVNIRPGDLLLINNHEVIHGNTPIVCEEGSERISLVCYLREGMLNLGTKEYEDYRYEFVEYRKNNKEHPLQRPLWNGISPEMWGDSPSKTGTYENAREWYEFLMGKPNGEKYLQDYHPHMISFFGSSGLEDFFS